jgi:hypothetical protein
MWKLGVTANKAELRIGYHGGQVRLYGADKIDALHGIYHDGVVLDEPADLDPTLWPQASTKSAEAISPLRVA